MFSTLKQLLGLGPKTDYAELKRNGAIILEVLVVKGLSHYFKFSMTFWSLLRTSLATSPS